MIGRGGVMTLAAAVLAAVACASAAERRTTRLGESPTMNDVRWDPATAILGCASGDAELTLPREMRDRVHVIAHDLVVVVLPQTSSALLVTVSPSFLRGKRAGVLGDLTEIWKELHRQVTGVDLRDGDLQGTFRASERRVVVEYRYDPPEPVKYRPSAGPDFEGLPATPPAPDVDYDPARERQWRLVYVEAGRCRIAAVDRTDAGGRSRLTPLLDELRIPPGLIPR